MCRSMSITSSNLSSKEPITPEVSTLNSLCQIRVRSKCGFNPGPACLAVPARGNASVADPRALALGATIGESELTQVVLRNDHLSGRWDSLLHRRGRRMLSSRQFWTIRTPRLLTAGRAWIPRGPPEAVEQADVELAADAAALYFSIHTGPFVLGADFQAPPVEWIDSGWPLRAGLRIA